jgi:pyruvate/2-oxoglutarate dehydrogenase complex dihydrolipoamide acyltransferase (E2) component
MPKLADTLVDGTLGKWLKQVGEAVAAGEPLASIETDKVTTELTAPTAGSVLELLVPEGQTVAIDTPIARIGTPSAPSSERSGAPQPATSDARNGGTDEPTQVDGTTVTRTVTREPETVTPTVSSPKVTPVAARLLAEHGLSAADLGAAKRVSKADVLRFIEQQRPVDKRPVDKRAAGEVVPLSSMRRAIAEHMVRARQTIPMGQTVMQADLTDLAVWREREKTAFEQREGAGLTYTVFFVHALSRALADHQQQSVNIGVAVAMDNGLIVPVIRRADQIGLGDTARAITDLATRARAGKLSLEETQGALMTVTNVGSFGNLFASPIVPLQQLGILGPGIVERRPMPGPDGGIRIGQRCWLTLMYDRWAFDDLAADRFLRSVLELLLQLPQHAHRG